MSAFRPSATACSRPIADVASMRCGSYGRLMKPHLRSGLGDLTHPQIRSELLAHLEDLSTADPRDRWRSDRERGLVVGVNQAIHFFFDDNVFSDAEIGMSLLDLNEVALIDAVKAALDPIIARIPYESDDDFIAHLLWPSVTTAAAAARDAMVGLPEVS
jgi:hypothetical protein